MKTNERSINLDILRGFAVLQMIVFHFAYDLTAFKFLNINFSAGFWYWFPRFIVFCFLTAMGQSLVYVHGQRFYANKMWSRFIKIAGFALLISIITKIMFPNNWIYFGTLHCIAVATLIGAPIARFPKLNLNLSIFIIISVFAFNITFEKLSSIVKIKSMDFIPIYPWYFVVGLSIFLAHLKFKLPSVPENKLTLLIAKIGRKSLSIYLIHQPILFGLCWLLYKIKHS